MAKNKSKPYRMVPRGCGFSENLQDEMVPVDLDEMADRGTRAQRRWAKRQLRRLNKPG